LYVLARGGVCVYSGPITQIQAHLEQITEIESTEPKFAIEMLIKHSCASHQDEIVQKLVSLTDQQYATATVITELKEQTQLVPDGVLPNRKRFSILSVFALSLRFIAYIRGYLWKEWAFAAFNFIGYGIVLAL